MLRTDIITQKYMAKVIILFLSSFGCTVPLITVPFSVSHLIKPRVASTQTCENHLNLTSQWK